MLMIAAVVTTAFLSLDRQGSACHIELAVTAKAETIAVSAGALLPDFFQVSVRNVGPSAVTLVEPGDGSDVGWRTPIVTWEIELAGATYVPPKLVRCGNINALRPAEIVDLEPGESRVFAHWIPPVPVSQPGTYRLRLRYQNDPLLHWDGVPLGDHDAEAMQRVRLSTACVSVSNQITVTVARIEQRRKD